MPRNIKDCTFEVRLLCHDCKTQLNVTTPLNAEKLQSEWSQLVLTSGFNAGSCPKGCRSTFSDLNINTDMAIVDRANGKEINYQMLRFLYGRFYTDDHDKVCECIDVTDDEIYISDRYPQVHGRCGQWIETYGKANL